MATPRLLHLVLAIVAVLASASAAWAEKTGAVGTFGPGRGHAALFDLVAGSREAGVRAELGGYLKSTSIGNLAGIEGGFEMGWKPQRNTGFSSDYTADLGINADIWLGFPVTLANLGDGKDDWLRWNIVPGLGTSLSSGYFYLKSALAMRLPVVGEVELTGTWWPDAASHAYGQKTDAYNGAALKLAYYHARSMHFFVQYRANQWVQHSAPVADDPMIYGGLTRPPGMDVEPFPLEQRGAAEQSFSVGIGWTPFSRLEAR